MQEFFRRTGNIPYGRKDIGEGPVCPPFWDPSDCHRSLLESQRNLKILGEFAIKIMRADR